MSTYDYDRDDPTFIDDLEKSKTYVEKTAEWLERLGVPAIVQPTVVRPDVSQRSQYGDDGDLIIHSKVEVKQRPNIDFQSAKDFPYKTLIVDACHIFDKHKIKPLMYVIWNKTGDAFIIVDVKKTRHLWTTVTKYDRFKNRDRHFYECPVNQCTFINQNTTIK